MIEMGFWVKLIASIESIAKLASSSMRNDVMYGDTFVPARFAAMEFMASTGKLRKRSAQALLKR